VARAEDIPIGHVGEAERKRVRTADVLHGHDWIESGEAFQDDHLFIVHAGVASLVRGDVQVVSRKHQWAARSTSTQPNEYSDGKQAAR
jgi:hypothetical protein